MGKGSVLTISVGLPLPPFGRRENKMPRGQKQNRQRDWESSDERRKKQSYGMNASFQSWTNYTIPASERSVYQEWVVSQESVKDIQEVVNDHYRLSIAEDLRDGGYIATAFMRQESSPNAGKMTSQRSGDPMNALFKVVFAIRHGMPLDWAELETGGDDDW